MSEAERQKAPPPADVRQWMRRDWEARARENARYYINTVESEGFAFHLSGCRDAFQVLGPIHERLRSDMRVLEIGCGLGRMLQFLAVLFAEVHGIDVAPTMIEEGRRMLAGQANAHLHLGDGHTLAGLPDGHFDLVVSFQVFQHVPDRTVIADYVADAFRVLRPGGLFRFLVKTGVWRNQLRHDTWCGVELGEPDLAGWLQTRPWEALGTAPGEERDVTWVLLRKPGPA